MRYFLAIFGCFITLFSSAQVAQQSLRVVVAYEKEGKYLEQAVATIEAVNTVAAATNVEYRAGSSIVMMPGFEARRGSIFTANIKPVTIGKEGDVKLQLTAFPNPFEHTTTIDYYLPADGKVNMWIVDAQGKIIERLVNEESQTAGQHRLEWKPQMASPGIYIPILEANQQKATTRLVKK
ncbi:T9SS type A sorting domain-containing protein [Spirosoma sp. KNUC1025]|uniref:T9SS type A sorting domain-containing protein n=1 Tax=Spirosoma sp. KNUC1025 TaxID=2894082 RepID=UPI00386375E0|nr:T9SS type A sorting domain-containing protein [Spirosoma sp. KNUC1025]